MTAEFIRPVACVHRCLSQDGSQDRCVQRAGRGDAERSLGRRSKGRFGKQATKASAEAAERVDLQSAQRRCLCDGYGPFRLKRTAHCPNLASPGYLKQRTRNRWQTVRVLVGIEVSRGKTGTLQLLDLCCRFADEVGRIDPPEQRRAYEAPERGAESFAIGSDQRGDGGGLAYRLAIDKDEVTAHTERRVRLCACGRIRKGVTGSHQSRRAQGTGEMEIDDRAIDPEGQAEVVRVEDES